MACLDAKDKVEAYSNWSGLMKGDLEESFEKSGTLQTRHLHPDHHYTSPDGPPITTKGRALLWLRNAGHLMTKPAILDKDGSKIPEGLIHAAISVLIAPHDLKNESGNSAKGSVYVVKPKMHGPEEIS